MASAFSIDPANGNLRIGDIAVLAPYVKKGTIPQAVNDLVGKSRDYGNGYEWLYLHGLTFGEQPAHLSLCFHDGSFEQASWNVALAGAPTSGDWPTREAIDAEVAFVRRTLASTMGIHSDWFPWGKIWSVFDAKSFLANNGLRYSRV